MSSYVRDFHLSGICTVNTNIVCKSWHDGFYLRRYRGENGNEFTLVVTGRLKVQISEKQAKKIILKNDLAPTKNKKFPFVRTSPYKGFSCFTP